ncbi:MAG: PmoA family protein [Gimesia sp.]
MKQFAHYLGFAFSILFCFLIGFSDAVQAESSLIGHITITAGKQAIENEPVFVSLPETGITDQEIYLVEKRVSGSTSIPAQIEKKDHAPDRLWFILPGKTTAGTSRVFEVNTGRIKLENMVSIKDTGKAYQFRVGKHPVLNYNFKHIPAPAALDALYGRSAYIHPIWTPGGKIVSDEFPPDHAHQSGQFLAYTKCLFEGRETNFWEIKSKKGRVRFRKRISEQQGPVFAELKVEQEHVDFTGPQEKVALIEAWTIRVWNQTEKQPKFWMYDLTSEARCATNSPLHLPKYRYGGMAIRGGRGWTKETCRFLTSNGKTRENGNHDRSRWCDISGKRSDEDTLSGFTILSHPDNFRHPEPVRIHPSMPYMVFTPSVLGDWKIEPGKPNISRYRFLVHDSAPLEHTDQNWQNYANPPQATFRLVTKN